MNENQIQAIINLELVTRYFKRNSINDKDLFCPEYDIASTIINKIKSNQNLSNFQFEEIANIYNEITHQTHFKGSGWMDFQLRLGYFFREFGYKATFDSVSEKLTITHENNLRS